MSDFSDLIERHLTSGNMSRADLARASRYAPGVISNLLSGKRNPTPAIVTRISEALRLSAAQTKTLNSAAARQRGFAITED